MAIPIYIEASNLIDERYKTGEIHNEQQYRNAFDKLYDIKMDLPSKLLEPIASIHELKLEEHTLIVMDKSTHEDHLSQPLQTNNKQFEIAVTILTGYKGIIKDTNKNIKF